jgi:mannonate dehydratase
MKLTFRWYGDSDPVTLEKIRQIPGVSGIVSAVYSVPVGGVWPEKDIAHLKKEINDAGLSFEVVESVPVHEDIKLGRPSREKYIAAYQENIRRLGKAGVKVICYNFMPVFDWTRSCLCAPAEDGSHSLSYSQKEIESLNPLRDGLSLPGWDASYKKEELQSLLRAYQDIDENRLMENLGYFLKKIIPVCAESHVLMALHPDDPPWPIFGLPRIARDEAHLDRILRLVDQKENGLTLCVGSLGEDPKNDVVHLAEKYSGEGRIHFVHLRNVALTNDGFKETAASEGSLDLVGVVEALVKNGFDGYARPDHGRMIWGEKGRPGYGLYDRALSATYIEGLWKAFERKTK